MSAIRGTPSPFGLLGRCVDVVDADDLHELNGTQMVPLSCTAAHTWQRDCPPPPTPNPASKTFDRPGLCEFDPVTVYAGATCSTFGMTQDEAVVHATETLRMGEQRALEEHFMVNALCTMAASNDLTPAAGPLQVAQGIAVLEGWLAEQYGGKGLLHVPAGAAALLGCCNVVTAPTSGIGCPQTLMGNGVVFGAGYAANVGGATCTQAPAGELWLYVTGPVRVRRGPLDVNPTTEAQSIDTRLNDRYVLAERTSVIETACCEAAAVRIST
ncbi:cupin [Streptomyces longwoodensis]|uniref:cupin n=1 Tax=Streptomyces longwoodensis TaxID=68231 RepID=UPI0036FCB915